MTPEVKKRIEQIRQGIVPEGYKKGKIGLSNGMRFLFQPFLPVRVNIPMI